VANNWRSHKTVAASKSSRRYTKIDEVSKAYKAAVQQEVMKILGVNQVDMSSQAYFEKHTTAAKHVYDRMDASEKKKVDEAVEKRKQMPNEPEVQQK
jgi:hypothetical protein